LASVIDFGPACFVTTLQCPKVSPSV
jgi:hypothetical protein